MNQFIDMFRESSVAMLGNFVDMLRGDPGEDYIESPLERYIGTEYSAENIKVTQSGNRLTIRAEEIPLDVLGSKVQAFVDIPQGSTVTDISYDKDKGSVLIFIELPKDEAEGTEIPVRIR